MKTHDLNARTQEIARAQNLSFHDARKVLGQHAAAARRNKRRRTEADTARADRARAIADRISP